MEVSSARPVRPLATLYLFAIFHTAGCSHCAIVRSAVKASQESQENLNKSKLRSFISPNRMYGSLKYLKQLKVPNVF